jgi:hypothetical protein
MDGFFDLEALIVARLETALANVYIPVDPADPDNVRPFDTIASEATLGVREDIAAKGVAVHIGPANTSEAGPGPDDRTRAKQVWVAAVTWPLPSQGGWSALGKAALAVVQALNNWKPARGLPELKFSGAFEAHRMPTFLEVDLEFTAAVYWPG